MEELKTLFFDIETSYCTGRFWRTGKQFISHKDIIRHPDIIAICWKWSGDKNIYSADWGLKKQNSAPMIEKFSKEVVKADLAIGHNGDKFDVRHINTQRLIHGQRPIAWPTTEDTLKQFRKHFYLPSYRLDYISGLLVKKNKDTMIMDDWVDIVEKKSQKALDKMIRYCQKDVLLLEKVYNKAKSFFTPKINAGLVMSNDKAACPRCGSKYYAGNGYRYTMAGKYQRRVCKVCFTSYRGDKQI